jgi:hypothetical protein
MTSQWIHTNPAAFPPRCVQNRAVGLYLDHNTAAAHHLTGFSLPVDLAQTNPLAQLLVVINLEVRDRGEREFQ